MTGDAKSMMTKSDLKISQKVLEEECHVGKYLGFEKTIIDWYGNISISNVVGFFFGTVLLWILFSATKLHREYTILAVILVYEFIVYYAFRPGNLLDRKKLIYKSCYKNDLKKLFKTRFELLCSDQYTNNEKDDIRINKINKAISEHWRAAHYDLDLVMVTSPIDEVLDNLQETKKAWDELENTECINGKLSNVRVQ